MRGHAHTHTHTHGEWCAGKTNWGGVKTNWGGVQGWDGGPGRRTGMAYWMEGGVLDGVWDMAYWLAYGCEEKICTRGVQVNKRCGEEV